MTQVERILDHLVSIATHARDAHAGGDTIDRCRCYIAEVQRWAGFALEDMIDDETMRTAQTYAIGKNKVMPQTQGQK